VTSQKGAAKKGGPGQDGDSIQKAELVIQTGSPLPRY